MSCYKIQYKDLTSFEIISDEMYENIKNKTDVKLEKVLVEDNEVINCLIKSSKNLINMILDEEDPETNIKLYEDKNPIVGIELYAKHQYKTVVSKVGNAMNLFDSLKTFVINKKQTNKDIRDIFHYDENTRNRVDNVYNRYNNKILYDSFNNVLDHRHLICANKIISSNGNDYSGSKILHTFYNLLYSELNPNNNFLKFNNQTFISLKDIPKIYKAIKENPLLTSGTTFIKPDTYFYFDVDNIGKFLQSKVNFDPIVRVICDMFKYSEGCFKRNIIKMAVHWLDTLPKRQSLELRFQLDLSVMVCR